MEEQEWYIHSKRKELDNTGPMKLRIWMEDAGKEHVWLHHTLGLTELYQGQVWLFTLEGKKKNKIEKKPKVKNKKAIEMKMKN